jgi:hypothetical protein
VSPRLANDELAELERAVERALETGDADHLEVVGYGEITTVLRWTAAGQPVACKRLPGLTDESAFLAYRQCVLSYLTQLAEADIEVPETIVQQVEHPDGARTAYCVQAVFDESSLLTHYLHNCDPGEAVEVFEAILGRIRRCVTDRVGLDAQISNWAWVDGEPRYVDISTPFLRNEAGEELFDVELHIASVPWALRGFVRRFLLHAILDTFYQVRGVLIDLLGNMHKERLDDLVPSFAEAANRVVSPPITAKEIEGYYREDARTWALLQALRRVDRWWQRKLRRRTYPFLLPGKIAR